MTSDCNDDVPALIPVRSSASFGGVRLVRVWNMPHKHTFRIPTVKCLLRRFMESGKGWADPFANNRSPAEYTNDLNPETDAKCHMDAVDFLTTFDANSLNGVLLDPPYSMHQCLVSYEGYGTRRVIALTPVYDEAARIVKPGGLVLTFGWNSNGIGAGRNFEMVEVVLIHHGGHHNDTIITVERKLEAAHELWAKPPNDPKLSDCGARRAGCMVGERRRLEAASVTRGAVRCSAWLN